MPDVNLPLPFDAYAGEESFVFVSYSHKDGHLVYSEIKALHDSGVRIWFDGGIDPGNEWPEDIAQALLKAKMFLVFITPSAVESKNVRDEINFAINNAKPFLAVYLQETQLPAGLALRMGGIQAIFKHRMIKENYNKKLLSTFSEVVVKEKRKTRIVMGSPESKKGRSNDETRLSWFAVLKLNCFIVLRYTITNGLDLIESIRTNGVKPKKIFFYVLLAVCISFMYLIGHLLNKIFDYLYGK